MNRRPDGSSGDALPWRDDPEQRREAMELEDERASLRNQFLDWVILGVMIAVNSTWMFIVYLTEPGIR